MTPRIPLPKTELEFRNALIDAAEVGAKKALQEVGLMKPYLKLREAHRMYGEAVVNRWIKEGLVRVMRSNNELTR